MQTPNVGFTSARCQFFSTHNGHEQHHYCDERQLLNFKPKRGASNNGPSVQIFPRQTKLCPKHREEISHLLAEGITLYACLYSIGAHSLVHINTEPTCNCPFGDSRTVLTCDQLSFGLVKSKRDIMGVAAPGESPLPKILVPDYHTQRFQTQIGITSGGAGLLGTMVDYVHPPRHSQRASSMYHRAVGHSLQSIDFCWDKLQQHPLYSLTAEAMRDISLREKVAQHHSSTPRDQADASTPPPQ